MSGRVPSEDSMLRIIRAAKECTVASERDLMAIKAPYTTYEAAVASIRTNIEEAFRHLPATSSPSDVFRLQDDIVRYGGELKELENQYKATLDEEEAAYEEQRRSVLEKLCRNLVTTLGLPLLESTVKDLSSRDPSDWQDGSSWARAESNQHPAPSAVGVEHESTTSAAHPKNSGGTTSRKRMWDGASPSNRCKRLQTGNIHFNEVFENGQAQTKRIIVQHPKENGRWYILRCDKHNLDFGDKPVLIAGSHISSAQHGKLSRQKAVVIKHFGIEVLGCDKTLAEKNNAAARAAFERARSGSQSISTGDSSARSGRSRTQSCQDAFSGGDRQNQKGREPVVDPTPGDVYLGFWGKAKKSWAVLLLLTKNIGDVGVRGTIESLGLTGKVPACYDYDVETKEFRWAEGYEDGGALVAKREFPVLYFDGPRKCGMYYHFAILLLFRPLIKLRIIGSKVSPREICSQAADAIQGLLRFYSQLYTLQRTPSFVPYFVLTSAVMHMTIAASSPTTTALSSTSDPRVFKAIRQGIADLVEMVSCHHFAQQALNILRYLAKKWNLDVDAGDGKNDGKDGGSGGGGGAGGAGEAKQEGPAAGGEKDEDDGLVGAYTSSLNLFAPSMQIKDVIGAWGTGGRVSYIEDTGRQRD